LTLAIFVLSTSILFASCAVRTKNLRLDADDNIKSLSGAEAALDQEGLYKRVDGLYGQLKRVKLTARITKNQIAPYFENEKDLTEFIAIYATLFRSLKFHREILQSYKIKKITIEENGMVGYVEIKLKGQIYLAWSGQVHEVQRWEKHEGDWYMIPQVFPISPPKKNWFKNPWRKTYDEDPV